MKPFFFNIDVLSACNLRCPSCPQGQDLPKLQPKIMTPKMLRLILEKAVKECVVTGVGLFNWTEPWLHPQLPELVNVVNSFNVFCYLSTNLNRIPRLTDLLNAKPHSIRISCSGFTQDTYGHTHKNGDIEEVKKNMLSLSIGLSLMRGASATKVHMLWHRYTHNGHEEARMKEYCKTLGFEFRTVDAILMPLDKVLDRWEGITAEPEQVEILLKTPLWQAQESCMTQESGCRLQEREITIDAHGRVQVCCAVYDPEKYSLGLYLNTPIDKIQEEKFRSAVCSRCMALGGHIYAMGGTGEPWMAKLYHSKLYRLISPKTYQKLRG